MTSIYRLFLYGLTICLTSSFIQAQTSTAALPNQFFVQYTGTVSGIPVQLLLERNRQQLRGLYYYEQYQKMLYLTGTIQDSGDFELKEFSAPSPNYEDYKQTGVFRGTLEGTSELAGIWISQVKKAGTSTYRNGNKTLLFHLTKQTKPTFTPDQLQQALKTAPSSAALQFLVANYITEGIDFQYLYYGDGYQTPYTNIHPDNMEVDLFGCNLFGDKETEAVMQVRFNNWLYLIAAFYPTNHKWQKIPDYLHFNRGSTMNEPCRTDVPNDHYFLFSLVEAQRAEEYVLEGRVYGGSCSGEYRGDEIYYYVWNVDKKGIHIAYNEIETKYTYSSSTAKALETPINVQFLWVSPPNQTFPKQLKRKEVHFQLHSDIETMSTTGLAPIDYTEKIGETTTTLKLF